MFRTSRLVLALVSVSLLGGVSVALGQADSADAAKGAQIYQLYCVTCHGVKVG